MNTENKENTESSINENANIENLLKDAKDKLDSVGKLKTNGNEMFSKGEIDTAIEFYVRAKEIIKKEILENFINENIVKEEAVKVFLKDVKAENIKIHSNLALFYSKKGKWEESVENDVNIVNYLDPLFDKSYTRLIINYVALDKIENAVYYYHLLKRTFNEETVVKYQSNISDLMQKNEKFKKAVNGLGKVKKNGGSNIMIYVIAIAVVGFAFYIYNMYKKPAEEVF